MNRKERQALQREQRSFVNKLPTALTPVPPEEFPAHPLAPAKVWRSRQYLVQMWNESNPDYPSLIRLSVCRVRVNTDGRWADGLTWDELQSIKGEIGYGDWYGVEVYPQDNCVINVANFRHLWLLPVPLSIGWF